MVFDGSFVFITENVTVRNAFNGSHFDRCIGIMTSLNVSVHLKPHSYNVGVSDGRMQIAMN